MLIQKLALLCGAGSWRCTAVLTSCDVLVHGRARWSFRGALTFRAGWVDVNGDRSMAGDQCQTPEHVPLPWADQ